MQLKRNDNYSKTLSMRKDQFRKSVADKGTATYNLERNGLIRKLQKEGD